MKSNVSLLNCVEYFSFMAAEEMVHDMGLSWGDQMDCLEELELRTPGRALQMHEKLSCATRKRSVMLSCFRTAFAWR